MVTVPRLTADPKLAAPGHRRQGRACFGNALTGVAETILEIEDEKQERRNRFDAERAGPGRGAEVRIGLNPMPLYRITLAHDGAPNRPKFETVFAGDEAEAERKIGFIEPGRYVAGIEKVGVIDPGNAGKELPS